MIQVEDKFYVERFFRKYKNLVDVRGVKQDKEAYIQKLNIAGRCLDKLSVVDFDADLLFISHLDVEKELYLNCLSKLDHFPSLRYLSTVDLEGEREMEKGSDFRKVYSEEIVCALLNDSYFSYIDNIFLKYYGSNVLDIEITEIAESRRRSPGSGSPYKTWCYYQGTETSITGKFSKTYEWFKKNG